MLNDNKHIDSIFADGLKNLSVKPNPKVWERITDQLAAKKKKRLLALYATVGVAASILIFTTIFNQYLLDYTQIDDLENHKIAGKSESVIYKTEESKKAPKMTNIVKVYEKSVGTITERKMAFSSFDKKNNKDIAIINAPSKHLHFTFIKNQELMPPNKIEQSEVDLPRENLVNLTSDDHQIRQNVMMLEQIKLTDNKKNKWSAIGQMSSAYSSYSGKKTGNSTESGIWNIGGGIKINYSKGEKLALQTGILYNRFGQNLSSGSGSDLHSEAYLIPNLEMGPNVIYPLETSAGAIKLTDKLIEGEIINLASYADFLPVPDLIQSFETIEVPLLLRYNLSQKKLGVFISGGLSANWIVGNTIFDNLNGRKTKIGKTADIRTTNFSSQFSFGVEYRLNSKLQIGLEPSFKYYVNSISRNNKFEYKPYSIGIFTGIHYNF